MFDVQQYKLQYKYQFKTIYYTRVSLKVGNMNPSLKFIVFLCLVDCAFVCLFYFMLFSQNGLFVCVLLNIKHTE